MKKLISIVMTALMIGMGAMAQSNTDLVKQRQELNKNLNKILEVKPTKEAKKQAKAYTKEGWVVPAGEHSIEQQLMRSYYLNSEQMSDDYGNLSNRFIQHTAQSVAGSYNAAFASCRANAQTEISTQLSNEIAAAVQTKLDNAQRDAVSATTVDEMNQRMRSIVHQSLSNSITSIVMYRRTSNNNYEVQVRFAYDKLETLARIKEQMRQELKDQGDTLLPTVNEALNQLQ